MDPRRWQRIKELFEAARDQPPSRRDAFVRERCGDDDDLRAEVASLLEQADAGEDLLDTPALGSGFAVAAPDLDRAPEPPPSSSIGSYRLIRLIGRGGMGAVYEAQQENPYRLVAIKVLSGPAAGERGYHERFQREVDALARLSHPGIASILEAGRTREGRDYLVMELVRGATLDRHVRERAPSRRARVELFLALCDAVNYAHQRGVIHRDLKPANVIVPEGEAGAATGVKILDFGLARMSGADVKRATMVTEIGSIMGTLPYMSPEQARGDPDAIDIRTDVYALGVILYELLCGRRPLQLPEAGVPEALRMICDDEPARPSGVDRRLRGDLETITLTALEKDPARRYQSAGALADDLRRFLADEPIVARPPSATYQFGKFVRRHTLPVALVVLLVVLSLAFGVIGTVQAVRLGRANQAAAAEAEQREQVLYCSQIARAQLLDDQHNLTALRQVLDECDPRRRGWEWSWLARRADAAELTMSSDGDPPRATYVRGDTALAATFASGDAVEIRDGRSWRLRQRFGDLGGVPSAVCFSGDGGLLATGDASGAVRVFRVADGRVLHRIEAFTGPVDLLWFGGGDERLVAAGGRRGAGAAPGAVRAWTLSDAAPLARIELPEGATALGMDADGSRLAVGFENGRVETWALGPVPVRTGRVGLSAPVSALAVLPGDDRVAIALRDRTLRLFDLAANAELRQLVGHDRAVTSLAVNPDGTHLASADGSGTLRVWRIAEGDEVRTVTAHGELPWWTGFSADGCRVVTHSLDGDVKLWSYDETGDVLRTPRTTDPRVFAFGAGPTCAMYDHRTRRVAVLDPLTGVRLDEFEVPGEAVSALAFDADAQRLAVGAGVRVFVRNVGDEGLRPLEGAGDRAVTSLAWSRDGRRLGAGRDDGRVGVWTGDGAARIARSAGHEKAIRHLVFDAGGDRIIAAGEDRLVTVWSVADLAVIHTLEGHTDFVHEVDLHPDGRRLVSASADGSVRLWDVETGAATAVLTGHEGAVLSARWSPAGDRIVSAGADVSIIVWHPGQRQALLSVRWPGHFVSDVAMTRDGRTIMARSLAGWVRTWQVGK